MCCTGNDWMLSVVFHYRNASNSDKVPYNCLISYLHKAYPIYLHCFDQDMDCFQMVAADIQNFHIWDLSHSHEHSDHH